LCGPTLGNDLPWVMKIMRAEKASSVKSRLLVLRGRVGQRPIDSIGVPQ
jgi:hypothetical protein